MPFLAAGVEHTTAPLSVRERLMLEGEDLDRTTGALAADPAVAEVAILSTCNRTEIYVFAEHLRAAKDAVTAHLIGEHDEFRPFVRVWEEPDAIEHLFRVACGLESQVPGEGQILSQVAGTLETAQRLGAMGANLHALFRSAISCARQARAGTALGRVNLSLGSEAVEAARGALGTLAGRSVLVIGAGEIGSLVVDRLQGAGLRQLFIANRTAAAATELAQRLRGTPVLLSDLSRVIPYVEVVFSATGARGFVVRPEDFVDRGATTPLHVFDLALPRDVDPAVGGLPGVELHDLESLIPAGLTEHWSEDVRQIERVIEDEIREFVSWYLTRRVAPVIAGLRSHVEAVSQQELRRVAPQLRDLTDRERIAVNSLTNRLIDKMFHHLVLRLRLAAQTDPKLVDAAEFFFLHGEGGLFEHAAQQTVESEEELPTS